MLTWYVADLKTGGFLEEVPFKATGLERTIGQKSTCSVTLDVPDASTMPGWDRIMDPRRCLIVPVEDDVPLAGYIITDAIPGDETVPFTLASIEAIPEHANVTTLDFFEGDVDESEVARQLLAAKVAPGWGFELEVTPVGKSADHSYSHYEDRSVASALADLSAQAGGPEWVTRIRWEDDTHRRFIKTIEIGPQVGRDLASTVFENHYLQTRRRPRSWQKLGVRVIATGDGAGESRPMSDTIVDDVAIAAGVPPWELRIPASSIDEVAGLNRVAVTAGARYRYGTGRWELEIAQTTEGAPRLIRDYDVGDTVTLALDATPYDTASFHGPVRVIGWRASIESGVLTQVTPVFWSPDDREVT